MKKMVTVYVTSDEDLEKVRAIDGIEVVVNQDRNPVQAAFWKGFACACTGFLIGALAMWFLR